MKASAYSDIDDRTMVRTEWTEHRLNAAVCTWAEWKASRARDLGDRDFAEIAAAIRDPSRTCIMADGLAISYISRVDMRRPGQRR